MGHWRFRGMFTNTKHAFRALTCVLLLTPLLLSLPRAAWADSIVPGGSCTVDPLSAYIGLGSAGCVIDDKVFANFTYTSLALGGAKVPAASEITVTPIEAALDPGLLFEANWIAMSIPEGVASTIGYSVSVLPGGNLIKDASLTLRGSSVDAAGEVVEVVEGLCLGAAFTMVFTCGTTEVFLNASDTLLSRKLRDSISFPPIDVVGVFKEILLNAAAFDTAKLAGVTNQFSEVSEPASLLLLGSGLVGLAAVAWRRHRR